MAPPRLTAEQKEELLARERVAAAYKTVFGINRENRTAAQQAVWDDLKRAGFFDETTLVADKAGAVCAIRGAFSEGRRWLFLYIRRNVNHVPIQLENNETK